MTPIVCPPAPRRRPVPLPLVDEGTVDAHITLHALLTEGAIVYDVWRDSGDEDMLARFGTTHKRTPFLSDVESQLASHPSLFNVTLRVVVFGFDWKVNLDRDAPITVGDVLRSVDALLQSKILYEHTTQAQWLAVGGGGRAVPSHELSSSQWVLRMEKLDSCRETILVFLTPVS
ncbi:hypothetical protein EXIGLDRAFT_452575 [Exidia glandulosa HHB12029]|uniref:Uncharacterized protein n=1 Tax=Exidia glandulosa HHB12029 TaxID=1314781 RepID=A0A165K6S0_EXIGL|nr:hypothetical protein EXIGLDRAFT_452575 [Exidia glandulosa HHB12029]